MFSFKLFVVVIVACVLLALRFYFVYANPVQYPNGQVVSFETTLHEEPELRDGKQRVRVKTSDNVTTHVVMPAFPLYAYGDHLQLRGTLTQREYEGYKYWSLYYPQVKKLEQERNVFMQVSVALKQHAREIFDQVLSPVGAGLMMGILFGGKQGLPESFSDQLRTTGVYHVIAASGMNVSFVAGALLSILGVLMRRQLALLVGIVGIIFYAFLAEFEPSIVRASIMAIFAFSAMLLGRQQLALFSVAVTAYAMVLYDPHLPVDVGFQLSFLSTIGILLIKPLLPLVRPLIVSEDISTTISAQIATLPILLSAFGQYGVLSVLVNALVLWTIPILMFFGSIGLLVGFVWPVLGAAVLWLCVPFLFYFEQMISFFGGLGGLWQIDMFPWPMLVGYYILLGGVIWYFRKKRKQKETERSLRDQIGM